MILTVKLKVCEPYDIQSLEEVETTLKAIYRMIADQCGRGGPLDDIKGKIEGSTGIYGEYFVTKE